MKEIPKPSSVVLVGTLAIAAFYMVFLLTNEYVMDSYRVLGVNYNMVAAAAIPAMFVSALIVRADKSSRGLIKKLAILGTTIPLVLAIMSLLGLAANLLFPSD